ncbi:MAG: copper resistance protein CopC [Rhodobacter sp.]|nr:copper resistance protein CopC [Paracoccaceae bacterium]MCB1409747.1 copper resistance protein CopC [Paracoccaceae bacterium]MCC0073259.1 copper resistance protein CopC [Rhodobacter sp.]
MQRLLVALIFTLLPFQAGAHAQLRASAPPDGAVVAEAPTSVTLEFNEAIAPLVLRHIGPDGIATDLEGIAENATITVTPPADLADGTHLLSWRVVSDDGHPVGGTLTFHVGAPSATPPTPAELAAGAARFGAALRAVLTVSLVVAVGAAVFAAFVAPAQAGPALARIAVSAAGATIPVGGLLTGVQGLDMLSLAPAALLTMQPWQAGLSAPIALTVVLAAGAAFLAALALRTAGTSVRKGLALGAWGLASLSFAASGHAAVAPPRAVALPAVTLHAAALIFWMGSLVPLLLALRGPEPDTILRRFSSIAVPTVALLILSGMTLTWLQSGSPAALLGSSYGIVLGAKLALVAGLLALAARNRLVLTPALAAGQTTAAPRLSHAIRGEIVLGLAILVLASGFRLTPPPRALIEPAEPLYAHIHTAAAMADIRLTPGRAGPVEVMLGFQTGDFAELVPQEVEVVFAQPEAGIEPIRLTALQGGDGLWHAGPVTLPRPGDWDVTLRLLITDFERVTLTDTLTLTD